MDRGKYAQLIDEETWAFIDETGAWYPPETADFTIREQREIYDRMCRAFHAGHPEGVSSRDDAIKLPDRTIAIREYHLTDSEPAAQVVYLHGGGYVVGGLESHDDVCAEICARTGFGVTSIDYRLAPENVFPADFDDGLAGFEYVAEQTGQPVVLAGDSAGGNLSAGISHACRKREYQPVGQVLIYPALTNVLEGGTYEEHADAPMLTLKETKFYKATRTGGNKELLADPRCSPLKDADFSGLPPTVVLSAECDPLSGDGDAYCREIKAAGGKAVWFNEKGLVHGYLRARHSVTRARNSFTRIVDAISALGKGQWPY